MMLIIALVAIGLLSFLIMSGTKTSRGGSKEQHKRYDYLVSRHDLRQPEIDEVRELYKVMYPEGYRYHQEHSK